MEPAGPLNLELVGVGNPAKVLALVLRNRGNGDLKCSAKDDICRMVNHAMRPLSEIVRPDP